MNVIILTPDRVGSTLLQRLITLYMLGYEFDKPVINLHELTNGLTTYYSDVFNQQVVGKPKKKLGQTYGYYQTLPTIVNMLDQVDHYKTARLAHYHIVRREDTIADQLPFYEYLNDNFFIISARRDNVFEYALSSVIAAHSKRLNVFTHQDKINIFAELYQNGITLEPEAIVKYLNQYKNYIGWVDRHFNVNSYFNYDRDLGNIESYIMNLSLFSNATKKKTWKDIYGIEWSDWNRCHKLVSDVGAVAEPLLLTNDAKPSASNLSLIKNNLSTADCNFLTQNGADYVKVYQSFDKLIDSGILVDRVPIKLQTMAEKRAIVKNFDQCIDVYNIWAEQNDYTPVDQETVIEQSTEELHRWYLDPPKQLLLK